MKCLLVFFLILCPLWVQAQSEPEIRQAMDRYEYEVPIQQIAPTLGDSVFTPLRAQALKAMSRYPEALQEWNSLLSPDSTNVKVLMELADCFRLIGRSDLSAQCYAKAVALNPENKYFRQQHIRTLLASENYEAARDAAHCWLERDTVSATGYKFLGMAYEGMAKAVPETMANAFFAYNAAYDRDSLDGQTVARIASLFNNNEQYVDAADITETYRLTDTVHMDVNRQNAKAYCMLKDYEKAVNRYEALKALGDQSFTTLYYLGISHYGQEWFYGAQENLELAYKKNPTDVNVLYYLAKSCARTSWKAEGIEYMKKALAQTDEQTLLLDSVVVRLYEGLVDCYDRWHESDPYEAIEVMKHTYTLTKKYFLFYKIAEVYDRQEDYANAVHYYEKYMALVPKDKQVALDAEGNVLTGYMTKYQIAKERITKIKEESFFRDGVK